jgi:hypothetical protein
VICFWTCHRKLGLKETRPSLSAARFIGKTNDHKNVIFRAPFCGTDGTNLGFTLFVVFDRPLGYEKILCPIFSFRGEPTASGLTLALLFPSIHSFCHARA